MPKYIIRAEYLSVDEFEVEASSHAEAEKLFMNSGGEYGDGYNTEYALNSIISVEETERLLPSPSK